MAHVQLTPASRKTWPLALGVAAAAASAVVWWSTQAHDSPVADAPSVDASEPLVRASPLPEPASGMDLNTVMSQQAEAAKALNQAGKVHPVTGPITERPAYVSRLEWMMLQGVVKNHPNPDQELTRMVNFLRFTKQLEQWQGMPRSADTLARRQPLARQLLDELPSRVANGDLGLKDAQETQAQLLVDAEPDPQARKALADIEARRLIDALPAPKTAERKR